ncbi:MAG: AMP-binding protein [Nevskiales bacterium]
MSEIREKKTLVHCLLHWEKTTPDAIYFTQPLPDGQVVDYRWREVADQVRRMAAHLQSLNLPPRSNIALLGKNSAHWIMADLAIWMAGHVTVPLYPTLNGETAKYILEHCEAKLLFIGKLDGKADGWNDIKTVVPARLPRIGLPMSPDPGIPQWDELIAGTRPLKDPRLPEPDDLATIVYTSGSTGMPKGVMQCFRAMASVAVGSEELFPLNQNDRMLSYLPLAHVAERAAVEAQSLYWGFRVYFANALETFVQDLRRARPTLFFSVPRLWTKFYLGINEKLPPAKQRILFNIPILSRIVKKKILTQLGMEHVRVAITGAAPLPPKIIQWYRGLGLELLELYGMSENFGYSHANRPGKTRVGYVGNVNPGCEHRIAENGEVLVKSPGQMLGYYKMDKSAEGLTPDGFFHTGDMGEIDGEGRLKITGRVKELFKTSKGKYVAPVPIENRINHPKIEVVCVAGASQPQPFALVMLSAEAQQELASGGDRQALQAELETLLDQVNAAVEDHEQLDYLVVVKDQWTMENGFLTPTMKIKRNVIEGRYEPQVERWAKVHQKVVWE